LRLWEVETGRCLRTFEGHEGTVFSARLSADGRFALSGSSDRTLKLWSVPTAVSASLVVSRGEATARMVRSTTEYRRALTAARQALVEHDAVTACRCLRTARNQSGYQWADDAVEEWSRLYVQLRRKSLQDAWQKASLAGDKVCLSADGRYALSASEDNTVKLWGVATGRCVRTFEGHVGPVNAVCLSADGRHALSGSSDHTIRLWEVATGRCIVIFRGHYRSVDSVVHAVRLSADGRYAVSGSSDRTLELWEVASGRCLRAFEGHAGKVLSVCLSTDGRCALSGSEDSTLKLWEVATGRCLHTFEGHGGAVFSVCLSTDGRYALSGSSDRTLKLWEVATGRYVRTFEGHAGTVFSVCLSTDGRYALSGSGDLTMKLWEVTTGRCVRTFEGHAGWVTSVCLSADGRYALASCAGRRAHLWFLYWDLEDNQPADWDEGARPYLEVFLAAHQPYARELPADEWPTEKAVVRALTREGRPEWTEDEFSQFLYTLGCAGYGWLRPEGVRRELEKMTADWK
jgi:WD40 repeat protein